MKFEKITEKDSHYNSLETKSTKELLSGIHHEDKVAVLAVGHVLDKIESLINNLVPRMENGGRLFYMGAGTSGRLGVRCLRVSAYLWNKSRNGNGHNRRRNRCATSIHRKC